MGVVEAKIQTGEDIYRLIWTAAAHKRPVGATYKDLPRLFCPHRLGRNRAGQLRVLLDGSWRSAPNHSRPASCVIEADIDAEDQPDCVPQKGQ